MNFHLKEHDQGPDGCQRIFGLGLVYFNCEAEYEMQNGVSAANTALTVPSLLPETHWSHNILSMMMGFTYHIW